MKTKFGKGIVSGLALAFAICVAASANAALTIYAGSCGYVPAYSTIQQAIDNSAVGGIVKVCPGTYQEQVVIKKNLTLEGFTVGTGNQAVITAPVGGVVPNTVSLSSGNPIAAQIYVHDATAVTISDVVVDGSGNGIAACSPNLMGIYYQDASGLVNHVVTRHQEAADLIDYGGCQWGLGIFVQSGTSLVTGHAGTSTVTVENSSVHDFMKNGITGNEAGTTLNAILDQVRGQGPTNSAENGIQIGFGAKGEAVNNTVVDEIYNGCTSLTDPGCLAGSASGILVYDSSNVTVSSNHVGNTQNGIAVYGVDSVTVGDTISSNYVDGTLVYDGIDLCGSTGGTISLNTVSNSGQSAIHLDGSCGIGAGGTAVSGNIINEACAAYLNNIGDTISSVVANTNNVVNTTLIADTATCVPPSGGDAVRAQTADSGQKKPQPVQP